MQLFIFVLFFVGAFSSATRFSADVIEHSNPLVQGYLRGSFYYKWMATDSIDNTVVINWNGLPNNPKFYIKTTLVAGSNPAQYTQNSYLVCGTQCDANRLAKPFPLLFYDAAKHGTAIGTVLLTVNGQQVSTKQYANVDGQSGGDPNIIKFIYLEGQSTSGRIVRAVFQNGRTWDFVNVADYQLEPIFTFVPSSFNCPLPKCNTIMDLVLVLDESGSISSNDFTTMKNFASNIASSFSFGPDGIEMAVVMFASSSRTVFNFVNNQLTAKNGIAGIKQNGGATCIGCGINTGMSLFNSRRVARATVQKFMIVLTDGGNNVGDLPAAVSAAKAAGTFMISIGVGSGVVESQLRLIADGPDQYLPVSNFGALNTLLSKLVTQTCVDVFSNPCGAGCKGFCACAGSCICPTCDDNNACTNEACSVNINGAGCVWTPKDCNDNNKCTNDNCNPSSGCSYSPVNCGDSNECTIDDCSPSFGCSNIQKTCNDGDPCTLDQCKIATGCDYNTPQACDLCKYVNGTKKPCPLTPDANLCRIYSCNPANGNCSYVMKDCATNNPCSIDVCIPSTGLCSSTPKLCNDNDHCTLDDCSPARGGCFFTQLNSSYCDDFNACTNETMDSQTPGCCVRANITCPFVDYCANTKCNSAIGCRSTTIDCGSLPEFKDKLGDCQLAFCTPNKAQPGRTDGCYLSLLEGKKLDKCGYCKDDPKAPNSCKELDLGTTEIAAIGAAVLALIIIGVILCVALTAGGVGGGLAYYKRHQGQMTNLGSNPLYEESNREGINPLYDQNN